MTQLIRVTPPTSGISRRRQEYLACSPLDSALVATFPRITSWSSTYVMFTPFDKHPNPTCNHGGGFSLPMENPNRQPQISRIKVYNLVYHFLRAPGRPTNSWRQGIKFFNDAISVFVQMEAQPELLGGLCKECKDM